MSVRGPHTSKVQIDKECMLQLPVEKINVLRRLALSRGETLGLIDDLPSYISAVLTVFDPGQCETIKKLLARYFDESFKAREKENLGPFLTDLKLDGEQIQVFLDLLNVLTVCEERDWMKYFVK